jgi:transposase
MKKAYLGIDAHKEQNTIALAFAGRGDPELYGKAPADLDAFVRVLRRVLAKYGLTKEDVALCYEAGPTGFVLVRRLRELGFECEVVAPSKIPKAAGDRVKTDRRDARKLARMFRAGDLVFVNVPDVADEVIRDVCRGRTDAAEVRGRARQQLGALLLRNGHRYGGGSPWSEAHMRYLRELVLPEPAQKFVLEEYLQRVDASVAQVERIEAQMARLLPTWQRRKFVEALQGFRGFQLVAAMTLGSELGDLLRFSHPRRLMAYVGLVPGENTTGERRRQGPITKCGNSHVRWMLVEVAHHYRYPPKVSRELSLRQTGLSREVRAVSWRAQERLHRRFCRLLLRGVHPNKVVIAIARELTAFVWELAQILEQERTASAPQAASRPAARKAS